VADRIRLLLADDHQMLREGLRRSLESAGFDVVGEAADGEQAVRLALELRPDLVLMDVSMPVLGGVGATRRLRQETDDVRVVMLTMHADEDVLTQAIRAGADAYLVKDCSTDDIAVTIRGVVAGEVALSAGLATTMLAEVRRAAGRDDEARHEEVVSRREEEVLQLIADGCSTSQVAERLFLSQKTVKNHLASIYDKLDARDRTQAVLRAVRMGIVRLD
jgi:two-component system, NarL family, response regulator DegU